MFFNNAEPFLYNIVLQRSLQYIYKGDTHGLREENKRNIIFHLLFNFSLSEYFFFILLNIIYTYEMRFVYISYALTYFLITTY